MIRATFDAGDFDASMRRAAQALPPAIEAGLALTLERIAANAKQTTTFVDRTAALRNSIQSDGVRGSLQAGSLIGTVGFAASNRGFFYGLAQEFGTRTGVTEKRFVRDAIDQETGDIIEDAMAQAFRASGFEVTQT